MQDVGLALKLFAQMLRSASFSHDVHKIETMERFYAGFKDGFKDVSWLKEHYTQTRHHLNNYVPENVDLVDVIEYLCDCVMAGMARTGEVYDVKITDETLQKAFNNTVNLLKGKIVVED